nr:chemotaxis protein CheW [Caldimonas mangrovi]
MAQAVQCGPWALAFPFSWARSIVEEFELSEVPHAPPWLLGAANVDGKVVPVLDLALYLDPAAQAVPGAARLLLVGGEGEDAAGIVFSGLPAMARPQADLPAPATPPALAEFITGAASDGGSRRWALVDAPALLEALSAELALA